MFRQNTNGIGHPPIVEIEGIFVGADAKGITAGFGAEADFCRDAVEGLDGVGLSEGLDIRGFILDIKGKKC